MHLYLGQGFTYNTAKDGPDFSLRTFHFCLERPLLYMLFGSEEVQVFKLNYPCYFYTSKWKLEPLCYWYAVSIFLLLRTFIFFLPKRKQILDLHAFKIISTLRCQACSVKCLIFLTTIRHQLFLWKHLPAFNGHPCIYTTIHAHNLSTFICTCRYRFVDV